MPDPNLGLEIDGRYTIESVIAGGGMGKVYRARQHSLDRLVAIKLLHPALASSDNAIKRFEREARTVSALRHSNTVRIHDFGCAQNGRLYFVMELLRGQPLRAAITPGVPMDPERVIDILSAACASLAEAHGAGVVHRDLKPDNIYLASDAGEEQVKVLDFGFAKLLDAFDEETLTATGMVGGTPFYLSPEMAQERPIDHRSDVYSLGVVLYEMLCGDPPFTSRSPLNVILQHVDAPVPSLGTKLPSDLVCEPLAEVAYRALEKDPDDRFQTIEDFAEALEAARPGEAALFPGSDTVTPIPSVDASSLAALEHVSVGYVPWWVPVVALWVGLAIGLVF